MRERYVSFVLLNFAPLNNVRILRTLRYWEAYFDSREEAARRRNYRSSTARVRLNARSRYRVVAYCILLCGSRCAPSRYLHERSQRPSSPPGSYWTSTLVYRCFWTFSPSLHVHLDSIIHSFLLIRKDGTSSRQQTASRRPTDCPASVSLRCVSIRRRTPCRLYNNLDDCRDYSSYFDAH